MNVYWFTAIFIAWYVLALVISERMGKQRKIGEEWSFFISIMLSPLAGLVACLISPPKENF